MLSKYSPHTLLFISIAILFSCVNDDIGADANTGSFTVDGIEYPIEKIVLLSSCDTSKDPPYVAYLLFMPKATTITNITCDKIEFQPEGPTWISMVIDVSDPKSVDAGTYEMRSPQWPSALLHPGHANTSEHPLVWAWLGGKMNVVRNGDRYSISLNFTFQDEGQTRQLVGQAKGLLTIK